jgi:hypothetical protein
MVPCNRQEFLSFFHLDGDIWDIPADQVKSPTNCYSLDSYQWCKGEGDNGKNAGTSILVAPLTTSLQADLLDALVPPAPALADSAAIGGEHSQGGNDSAAATDGAGTAGPASQGQARSPTIARR